MPNLDSLMGGMGGLTLVLTTVPFLIVVLVLVMIARRSSAKANASKDWPSTSGQVLMSQIEMRRSSGRNTGMSPFPVVVYEYTVMGQRYQSNRIAFGGDIGGSMIAQPTIAKYPAGSMVTVYYNPQNPGEAVLEQRSRSSKILVWVAVFIVAMLACTVAMTLGMMGFVTQFVNQFTAGLPGR